MDIKTVKEKIENLIIIKNSKFITYLLACNSKDEAELIIEETKASHIDATHVCYAYIIMDENVLLYKAQDDGEPSGTAGAPILNVLKKNDLCNVICLVVRYFGGIKLGAGGLTRAYSQSASEALLKTEVVLQVNHYYYNISFAYDKIKDIDKLIEINNIEITNKEYDLYVTYEISLIDEEALKSFINKIEYLLIEHKFNKIILK